MVNDCPLCNPVGERVIWRGKLVRVIDASDDDLPGFVRVIVKRHAAEMVDLTAEESAMVRKAVRLCELCMLETMHPDKINLASLGNMVPHVHWHVIARYKDDAFFPDSIWSPRRRTCPEEVLEERRAKAKIMLEKLPSLLTSLEKSVQNKRDATVRNSVSGPFSFLVEAAVLNFRSLPTLPDGEQSLTLIFGQVSEHQINLVGRFTQAVCNAQPLHVGRFLSLIHACACSLLSKVSISTP